MSIKSSKPFVHICSNGTRFDAARCDLSGGVTAHVPSWATPNMMIADAIEMAAFHASQILPHLPSFNGYAGIPIKITRKE